MSGLFDEDPYSIHRAAASIVANEFIAREYPSALKDRGDLFTMESAPVELNRKYVWIVRFTIPLD